MPAVAALRRRVFRSSDQPDEQALARYMELVLFDNPCADEDLPSLAVEGAGGQLVGFVGRLVRSYRQGPRALRGAVATEVMVDPDLRGRGIGLAMLRAHLDGGQDFTVADRANVGFRRLCERCGGEVAAWHSWYWTVPLRPSRFGAEQLGWRGLVRLSAPFSYAFDALSSRIVPGRFRRRAPIGSLEALEPGLLATLLPRCVGAESVYPVYDGETLTWLFQRLAERCRLRSSSAQCHAVRFEPHGIVGWFIAAVAPGGTWQTVQLAALPEHRELVLAHLIHTAFRGGAVSVEGRCDRFLEDALVRHRLQCMLAEPWVVVHSNDPRVAAAFRRGDVFLSRLEAEWWLAT